MNTESISNSLKSFIDINYNSNTYNLENPDNILKVTQEGDEYQTAILTDKKPIVNIRYNNTIIISNNIHDAYVILQYIMDKQTLIDLSRFEWDYSKWNVEITFTKVLPDWAKILNCLLNLNTKYNKPIKIDELNELVTLTDKRGWGGERPREIYYKLGFPFYTSKTKKTLVNSERLFECPFPICRINPKRKAVVSKDCNDIKCFTCGTKEGDINIFGNICTFEKGHFDPHINGGTEEAGHQCKWCNSFYKDKVSWNKSTGKPTFNSYAILRDERKSIIIADLKKLGFTPKDLE
jgi:hypothetical protein